MDPPKGTHSASSSLSFNDDTSPAAAPPPRSLLSLRPLRSRIRFADLFFARRGPSATEIISVNRQRVPRPSTASRAVPVPVPAASLPPPPPSPPSSRWASNMPPPPSPPPTRPLPDTPASPPALAGIVFSSVSPATPADELTAHRCFYFAAHHCNGWVFGGAHGDTCDNCAVRLLRRPLPCLATAFTDGCCSPPPGRGILWRSVGSMVVMVPLLAAGTDAGFAALKGIAHGITDGWRRTNRMAHRQRAQTASTGTDRTTAFVFSLLLPFVFSLLLRSDTEYGVLSPMYYLPRVHVVTIRVLILAV